jgi:integrase
MLVGGALRRDLFFEFVRERRAHDEPAVVVRLREIQVRVLQLAAWLKRRLPLPAWIFSSATGTALDESNVRKAFNRLLDAAELDRRGPRQLRHTFASQLLQDGAPTPRGTNDR